MQCDHKPTMRRKRFDFVKQLGMPFFFTPRPAGLNLLLERLGIGFVLWRLFVQQGDQFAGGARGFYLATVDDVFGTELLPVELFVGTAVGAQRGAFQGDTSEQPLGSRIGQNLSVHYHVSSRLSSSSFRTRGRGCVRSQLHFAGQQRLGSFGIHHQQHEIRRLAAQLEPDVDAFQSVQSGGSPEPSVVSAAAADHDSAAIASPDSEGSLLDRGQNNHTFRLVEQILGNVIRDVEDLFQDHSRLIDATLFPFVVGGERGDQQGTGKKHYQWGFHQGLRCQAETSLLPAAHNAHCYGSVRQGYPALDTRGSMEYVSASYCGSVRKASSSLSLSVCALTLARTFT